MWADAVFAMPDVYDFLRRTLEGLMSSWQALAIVFAAFFCVPLVHVSAADEQTIVNDSGYLIGNVFGSLTLFSTQNPPRPTR